MTAEAAMVLPVLVLVVTTLVWVLLVVLAQIQCVDAARAPCPDRAGKATTPSIWPRCWRSCRA
ncbi:TadE family type IV pilus minor pilin, partial [Streptomyces sp. NPDC000994]